jgi:RNA polymerase sigma-70 factor, ECF subfamily
MFLDVWRRAASFEGRASVSTWLFAIARYKALSARRARLDAELDERITSTVADPADTPEAALQEKRRGELLRKSLAKLSPEHSEVICGETVHDDPLLLFSEPSRHLTR